MLEIETCMYSGVSTMRLSGAAKFGVALSLYAALMLGQMALAEGATVSMVTLKTTVGQNGQQLVITPKGYAVPLPGAGVNGDTVQIYMGSQGGYWYVDRTGSTVDLTGYVQQFHQATGQTQQVPQYAPTTSSSQSSSGSSGRGSGLLGTAAAAGLGVAAGAAIADSNNNYYPNVPYGTPLVYGAGPHPYYYNPGGNKVYVNTGNSVNVSGNTVNATATATSTTSNTFQKQQDWYNREVQSGSESARRWQANSQTNPFVHSQANAFGGADAANAEGRRGRFGRRGDDQPGQAAGDAGERRRGFGRADGDNNDGNAQAGRGRFGRGNDDNDGQAGGRFGRGNSDNNGQGGRGRFGRGDDNAQGDGSRRGGLGQGDAGQGDGLGRRDGGAQQQGGRRGGGRFGNR